MNIMRNLVTVATEGEFRCESPYGNDIVLKFDMKDPQSGKCKYYCEGLTPAIQLKFLRKAMESGEEKYFQNSLDEWSDKGDISFDEIWSELSTACNSDYVVPWIPDKSEWPALLNFFKDTFQKSKGMLDVDVLWGYDLDADYPRLNPKSPKLIKVKRLMNRQLWLWLYHSSKKTLPQFLCDLHLMNGENIIRKYVRPDRMSEDTVNYLLEKL